jgi:hypothetical protein
MRAAVVSDEAECDRIWALADRVFAPYATYRREAAEAFFRRLSRQRPKDGGYRRPERNWTSPRPDTEAPSGSGSRGGVSGHQS